MEKNEKEIEATKKLSIIEAGTSSIMTGGGDSYIIPYALVLNATNSQIGFISSFVGLFGASAQILGSKLVYSFKRKKVVTLAVILQASFWLLIASLGILYRNEIIKNPILALIIFYCLAIVSGSLGGPAWFSMLGDLIPQNIRGKFFSNRNKLAGTVSMITTFLVALFLDYAKKGEFLIAGFIIVFSIVATTRYISAFLFSKHYEPSTKTKKDSYFGFWKFIKKAPSNNFGKFVIYVGMINFATMLAGPFFAVYMLDELKFSYLIFTLVNISAGIFTIMSLSLWGKLGDKYGNISLLRIGSIIIPFASGLWLVSQNPIYLIFIPQLAAGVGWAAFNLGASNFIYDAVTPERRAICVAYFTMVNGIGIFLGALAGGFFLENIKINFMNIFLLLFLISTIMRILASSIMLPKIKEVRKVESLKTRTAIISNLYISSVKPITELFRGVKIPLISAIKPIKGEQKPL